MAEKWKHNTEAKQWELWVDEELFKAIPENVPTGVAIMHLADIIEETFGEDEEDEEEITENLGAQATTKDNFSQSI